jgi:DNA-binding response OmpR family regulator
MFEDRPVLIIEDNVYMAMDLAAAVEQLDGRVVGPAGTVAEGLSLLDSEQVAAAVLDYELPGDNVVPLARALVLRQVPFVIHSSAPVAAEMTLLRPGVPVLLRPIQPQDLLTILAGELIRAGQPPVRER